MPTLHTFVPAAALLGLSSASFLTAYITSFTILAYPLLRHGATTESATFVAKQWQRAYDLGTSTSPPIAVGCAACFGFLAVQTRGIVGRFPVSPSTLYAIAAMLVPSVVPYTRAIMRPSTIAPLEAKASGQSNAPGDQETLDLLKKWNRQNVVRAMLSASAAVLSALAILAQVA